MLNTKISRITNALLFCFFLSISASAQNMDKGFKHLSNNEFSQAAEFFSDILQKDRKNKTARICYGRAIGLNGEVHASIEVFTELKKDFPIDQEVDLNLGEAFMWKNDYAKGKEIYTRILQKDASNFTALQGLANASSALKEFDQALQFINQALVIDSANANATLSKKYILLGLANDKRERGKYEEAKQLLDEILGLFPLDRDAILNLAINELSANRPDQAATYYQMLLDEEIDVYEAYMGLSYTSLLLGKERTCLTYADQALAHSANEKQLLKASINKVNSLGFAKEFKQAFTLLDSLELKFPTATAVRMGRARMHVWNRDFDKGLEIYEQSGVDQDEFELLMGQAEAYRGKGQLSEAIATIKDALNVVPGQADAMRLLNDLEWARNPVFQLKYDQSKDQAGNEASHVFIRSDVSLNDDHRLSIELQNRTTAFTPNGENANQMRIQIADHWQVNEKLKLEAAYTNVYFQDQESLAKSLNMYHVGLSKKIGKYQSIGLSYDEEAHNYSSQLVQEGLIMRHLKASYHFESKKGLGIYSQWIKTNQSDENSRRSLFISAYYKFSANPLFMVGANYNNLKFMDRTALYFSPEQFTSAEVFAQASNRVDPRLGLKYNALIAIGSQTIEANQSQKTRRIELGLGYKFSGRMSIHANYVNSNAAQSSVAGFQFQKFNLNLDFRL